MKIKKKYIYLFLTAIWMMLIFHMSSENADVSGDRSFKAGEIVVSFIKPKFKELSTSEKSRYIESIDFYVRKAAHMSEYGVLLLLSFMYFYEALRKRPIIWAYVFSVLYAISDEIHQRFVPGRAGQIRDVLIDALGAFIMATIIFITLKLKSTWKDKENVVKV